MPSTKQTQAAKKNIRKAQAKWQKMTPRQRAIAQPEGEERAAPGEGGGEYYRIEVRPKSQFTTFRYHDVGEKGGIQRLAGKRSSGSWADHAWLISKDEAEVKGEKLVPTTKDAREVIQALGSEPVHLSGDRFKAKPRRNVAEKDKPTPAQKRAQQANIKKAQTARRKKK